VQEQLNQANPETGRKRLHSSADPARHVTAADLPIHTLMDREHDCLAYAPGPNHLLHRGEHPPDGSILGPHRRSGSCTATLPPDLPEPDGSVKGEQTAVNRSKNALCPSVLDQRGKLLVLTLDAVRRPERATHSATPSVGQVHHERVAKRTSELHHVLRCVHATVQQDHARPSAQTPKTDPRAVSGNDRPRRNAVCSVSHHRLARQRAYSPDQAVADLDTVRFGLGRGLVLQPFPARDRLRE
jgi:hypothetical protein